MGECSNCGTTLAGNEDYCPGCGRKIKREEVVVEEESSKTPRQPQPRQKSSGFNWGRLFLFLILIAGAAFALPKLPMIMASAGIDNAPGVEPLEVRSTSIRFQDLDQGFVLDAEIYNPNSFNADLGRVTYDVYVEEERVASGEKQTYESIESQSTATITSDVNADLSGSLGAGASVLGNALQGEASYARIEGEWHYQVGPASFSIPFEDRSRI